MATESGSHHDGQVGFAHRRLSIIDLRRPARQPMTRRRRQLDHLQRRDLQLPRAARGARRRATSVDHSDTESSCGPIAGGGRGCVDQLRGMFAFALWDETRAGVVLRARSLRHQAVLLRRVGGTFYFASEIEGAAAVRARPSRRIWRRFKDYLDLPVLSWRQDALQGHPGAAAGPHAHGRGTDACRPRATGRCYYELDFDHTARYFEERLRELLADSVRHAPARRRAASAPTSAAASIRASSPRWRGRIAHGAFARIHRQFHDGPDYDESRTRGRSPTPPASICTKSTSTSDDFVENIREVIYHLDYPVAGPGSFPQYMVLAARRAARKVVLGGQGGDEIFGGYTRYLIAYFEQCIKAAIDGTTDSGNFVVTYESIIPNLTALRNYKPLLAGVLARRAVRGHGPPLFPADQPRAVARRRDRLGRAGDHVAVRDRSERSSTATTSASSPYFDQMTHFDFKTLLAGAAAGRRSREHGARRSSRACRCSTIRWSSSWRPFRPT